MPHPLVRLALLLGILGAPLAAMGHADDGAAPAGGPSPGMQPVTVSAQAAPFAGESPLHPRPDATHAATPEQHGTTKIYHRVAREAPWSLRPGLAVVAKTDNGPDQRVDAIAVANQKPGTWMIHRYVLDYAEDGTSVPNGRITTLHYVGTSDKTVAAHAAMTPTMSGGDAIAHGAPVPSVGRMSFISTALLGLFAGLTIFLGLPIARARKLKPSSIGLLNAFAIGILVFLVIDISMNAIIPVTRAITEWHAGAAFPLGLVLALGAGLMIGLVGLGAASTSIVKRSAQTVAERPIVLAAIIALGIGAHNFAEGLAIGASAASGATAIAIGLILGFALHNATEGFGVAAPLAGKVVPTWAQLGLAGLVAGGPTFIGTMIGYQFSSPTLSIFFLATAIGALVFVIGELWSVLKKTGVTVFATSMVTAGFVVAFVTELVVSLNGG